MSTTLETTRGHVSLFSGSQLGDGTRLIGIVCEGPGTGSGALLTPEQAVALAVALLERAVDKPKPHAVANALYDIGYSALLP